MSETTPGGAARQPTHPTETLPPPELQQKNEIQYGKIGLVAIGCLVVFAIGAWWSFTIFRSQRQLMNPGGLITIPSELGQEEIGIVDQVPFELNRWVPKYRASQLQQLDTYGWVDRKAGIIRIPIDRAMDLLIEEQKR